jgi:hypothetical protein
LGDRIKDMKRSTPRLDLLYVMVACVSWQALAADSASPPTSDADQEQAVFHQEKIILGRLKVEEAIIECDAATRAAKATIEHERRVARVSGYESTTALHEAGETIVRCEDEVPRKYVEYRSFGGTMTVEQIDVESGYSSGATGTRQCC